ncbi:DUF2059 domain-containing protein [Natronohydrobacter thiooxidans]|jgi:hypothetical protein|uniref:DUF2059 domain-containing protein n=1 Tax=Natronohydrobacter thiooxidans TaxID=87172 RepID=UPI000ADF5FCD|nr:DUF2059 domain-containing protein [Natronohydrobacter thiooxidans]
MSAPAPKSPTRLLAALAGYMLLLFPLTAQADPEREARLAVARAYVAVTLEDLDVPAMMRAMYRPVLDQVRSGGQQVTPEQEAQVEALYLEVMSEPMIDMLRSQDELMADLFSLSELEALNEFYRTELGRSVMQKLPQVVEAQMPQTIMVMQENMQIIMPQLMRILY